MTSRDVFGAWADPDLKHHSHEEVLVDGALQDTQAAHRQIRQASGTYIMS